jgi:uroporphyrinogen decarboxylase
VAEVLADDPAGDAAAHLTGPGETRPFLAAARGGHTATAPVWLMRQAGRYLPEYRALREKHPFWQLVTTPELAAEVTLQPLRRFELDAAILFSDIMTPLPSLGVEVAFQPGPVIASPVTSGADLARLRIPDPAQIAPYVGEAIRMIVAATDQPLIGFAGAPLTLASYLVQGSGGGDFTRFRAWLHAEPVLAQQLLELLTELTIAYLRIQIEAGVSAIQVFDSWAGIHDQVTYSRLGLPLLRRIFDALGDTGVPRIYLAVGASHLYPLISELPVEMVSVDRRLPLTQVRQLLAGRALQGNLDPAVLLTDPEVVRRETRRVLGEGLGGAHVFNLGHGVLRHTPVDNVARLVETVHTYPRTTPQD